MRKLSFIILLIMNLAGRNAYNVKQNVQQQEFSQAFGKTLIIGFDGQTPLDPDVQQARELIENKLIAGVILFRYNIVSREQVKQLIAYLKNGHDIIVALDQEGGNVNRIDQDNGFSYTMPAAKSYNSAQEVHDSFTKIAIILNNIGVNLNFAPVLDIDHDPASPVIGKIGRSFSSNAHVVAEYGLEAINALKAYGIAPCGKHFPGHGSAQQDSHLGFTDVTNYWSFKELYPFEQLKDKLPYIMIAHTFNAKLDAEFPASVSRSTYQLMKNYHGKFVADDYYMVAIATQYNEAEFAVRALQAGSSYVIFGQHPISLKRLNKAKIPVKELVLNLHNQAYLLYKQDMLSYKILKSRIK